MKKIFSRIYGYLSLNLSIKLLIAKQLLQINKTINIPNIKQNHMVYDVTASDVQTFACT